LQASPTASSALKESLVTAYFYLGEAFAAEKNHEDRDSKKAAKVSRCRAGLSGILCGNYLM